MLEEDDNGNLTVATNYAYDALGRLLTISQGIQTRSFTYDNLGRLKSETHPESGTTLYTYDNASNLWTKTDARGITTTYSYDALNRVTLKIYSDATPTVSYFYDSSPPGTPIQILNPVGRLTRVTTTTSGVTATSYYSYCTCSAVDQEATVITDGTTKIYITTYTHDYLGGITSISYPNGKVVTYTRDDIGREIKVSSTMDGQAFDYVRSASYLGPSGQLTSMLSGDPYGNYSTTYSYSAKTQRLTGLTNHAISESFEYQTPESRPPNSGPPIQTGLIYDITDYYYPNNSKHYQYDRWNRLTAFWLSPGRDDPYTRKLTWTYDQYNNITGIVDDNPGNPQTVYQFTVDPTTNRMVQSYMSPYYYTSYAYDSAGNDTTGGRTYDAENRLTYTGNGYPQESYLYDGNSHRLRTLRGTTKTYYIYSSTGLLMTEDDWTDATTENQIYFNGQLIGTHDQADYVHLYFKDHLGSVVGVVRVSNGGLNWDQFATREYFPFGMNSYGWGDGQFEYGYAGKLRSDTGLTYFGARYYGMYPNQFPLSRWLSADSVTAHIYDPQSLNKYTYVRNDPVNKVDPDGKQWRIVNVAHDYHDNGDDRYFETAISSNNFPDEDETGVEFGGGVRSGPTISGSILPNVVLSALFNVNTDISESMRRSILQTALNDVASRLDRSDCATFLNGAIATLKKDGLLNTNINSAHDLLTQVLNRSDVWLYGAVHDAAGLGKLATKTWAQSGDSQLYLGESFYTTGGPPGGDRTSTIIHELLQIGLVSANGKIITDLVLDNKLGNGEFESYGNQVTTNCGIK